MKLLEEVGVEAADTRHRALPEAALQSQGFLDGEDVLTRESRPKMP